MTSYLIKTKTRHEIVVAALEMAKDIINLVQKTDCIRLDDNNRGFCCDCTFVETIVMDDKPHETSVDFSFDYDIHNLIVTCSNSDQKLYVDMTNDRGDTEYAAEEYLLTGCILAFIVIGTNLGDTPCGNQNLKH